MGSGKPVLVVEEEPDVRSKVEAMLTRSRFRPLAKDGASALHQLWKRGGNLMDCD
jgi:hypothetical protein